MSQSATQEQTDAHEENQPVGEMGRERLSRMDEIAAARRNEIAEESGIDVETLSGSDPASSEAAPEAEAEAETAPPEEASGETPDPTPENETPETPEESEVSTLDGDALSKTHVTVKVDGEEVSLPIADVVRGYQKDAAASKRLEEAARRLKDVEEREAALANRASAQPAESPDTSEDEAKPPGIDSDAARKFLDAIYSGEEEQALEVFTELLETGRQPTTPNVDVAEITEQVRGQIRTESALASFATEYPDIVNNPQLSTVADQFLAEIMGEEKDFPTALKKAGEQTREWLTGITGKSQPSEEKPTTPARTEKQERKAEIDNLPSAGTKAEAPMAETTPATASDVIRDMRRQRGLPT